MQVLSKPSPNFNSMQLGLGLDTVLTWKPPPQTIQPLLDKLGTQKKLYFLLPSQGPVSFALTTFFVKFIYSFQFPVERERVVVSKQIIKIHASDIMSQITSIELGREDCEIEIALATFFLSRKNDESAVFV